MTPWTLLVALLQVSPASSASVFFQQGSAGAIVSAADSGNDDVLTPTCAEACDEYKDGATQKTEAVCIDASRTCGLSGCAKTGLCLQRFNDDCADHCSEWADTTETTLNVCQSKDKKASYKCSAEKECGKDHNRCKQKKIQDCFIFCEGYGYAGELQTDQNSDLVCQNINADAENFGICMPLPCSMNHHLSNNYKEASVCRQAMPNCKNSCAAGSHKPNATSVCFDEYSNKCENHLKCPDTMTRCSPVKTHQDLSNLPKEKTGWSLSQSGATKHLTQAESRAEQQRERVAALKRHMAAQRPSKADTLMRRDAGEAAK